MVDISKEEENKISTVDVESMLEEKG